MQTSINTAPFEDELVAIGRQLRQDGFQFYTTTPVSHALVLKRATASSDPRRDVFGWNRFFEPDVLPSAYRQFLAGPLFEKNGGKLRSLVRFSSLGSLLIAHSAFPTVEHSSVFFGPDTYRFCRAIAAARDREPGFKPRRIFDVGAGSGAGGLFASNLYGGDPELILADINPDALRFAKANASLNGISRPNACQSDILDGVAGQADLIVSNPPYLIDASHRAYRDGGGEWGERLGTRILEQALPRLAPGGRLILYTGSAIVDGRDTFLEAVRTLLEERTRYYLYEEIDPDVFGEELQSPPYDQAERIAATVLHVRHEDIIGG